MLQDISNSGNTNTSCSTSVYSSEHLTPIMMENLDNFDCYLEIVPKSTESITKPDQNHTGNGHRNESPRSTSLDVVCVTSEPVFPGGLELYSDLKPGYVIVPIDSVRVEKESGVGAAEEYKCWPPPWFTVTVSALQLLLFLHYTFIESHISHRAVLKTVFLWQPAATLYVWRYVIYSLYHIGWVHLSFNLAVQMCLGVPLEMIHGAARVAAIYISGVFLGSLSTILVDQNVVLVGSSAGVYALLAAHLADVFLNHSQMELGRLKLFAVVTVALLDIALAWLNQASSIQSQSSTCAVSHVAHVTGAAIGLLLGLAVLKTFTHSFVIGLVQKSCRILLFVLTLLLVGSLLLGHHSRGHHVKYKEHI